MDTWVDILTDPHHLLADFLMNVGFEILFAWITYLVLAKMIVKKINNEKKTNNKKTRKGNKK
jgi:hypothetical protein